MSTYSHYCNSDYRNEGWSFSGSGVNECWRAWSAIGDDSKYCSNPSNKGRACVKFPIDLSTSAVPDGALITSVTLMIRFQKTDSASRSLTVNFMSKDDTSRYTSRTLYPTTSIATVPVGTFTHDALGFTWTKDRLDRIMVQAFSTCGSSGKIKIYELYAVVNYAQRPVVKVTAPTGSVTSPPTFTWTYSQPDGDFQKSAVYKVFTAAQQEDRTFDPNSTPSLQVGSTPYTVKAGDTLWGIANDKLGDPSYWIDIYNANLSVVGVNPDLIYPGQVLDIPGLNLVDGDITSVVGFTLPPGNYYVYVQAESVKGALSQWNGRAFSISGSAPGVPGGGTGSGGIGTGGGGGFESVLCDPITSSVQLTFRDGSNLLSPQQADQDTDVATDSITYNGNNCVVSQDNTVSYTGGNSLKMTASSAAEMYAITAPIEVSASSPITARAQFYAPVTARSVTAKIRFYDGGFTFLSEITDTETENVGSWVECIVTGTVPTGAVYAKVSLHVASPANGEVHNVDQIGLMYGTDSAWSSGGHASRNILSGLASQASAGSTVPFTPNAASSVAAADATGTGADGPRMFSLTYNGISPSISYVSTATAYTDATSSSGFTLNKPASVADGDLLVAYVSADIAVPAPAPSGWTVVNSQVAGSGSTASSLTVMMRDALSADPSTWVGDFISTHARCRTTVVCYRGAASTATQLVNNSIAGGSTGVYTSLVPATPTVTNVDPNAWRLSAFAVRDDASSGAMTANTQAPTIIPAISYVGAAAKWTNPSGDNTAYKINKPSGVISGDLMIAGLALSGTATVTAPSGWTVVRTVHTGSGDQHSGAMTFAVLTRVAGGSEPTSWSGTHTNNIFPKITQCVAYRNANTVQFIDEDYRTGQSTNMSTNTVTNTDSKAWRISMFAPLSNQGSTESSNEVALRVDGSSTGYGYNNGYPDAALGIFDSNGPVSTGNHSRSGSANTADNNGLFNYISWIALIKPLSSAPAPPGGETERQDATAGSSTEWLTQAVYDSNGPAPAVSTTIYGSFTPGSGTSTVSSLAWLGFLSPSAPSISGDASVNLTTPVDITAVNPIVLSRAGNQMTVQAALSGTTSGSAYLVFNAYVGNELKSSQTAPGSSFGVNGTDPWIKSVATFPIPDGTTRVGMGVIVPGRSVADVVYFDRVSMSFGSATVWRPGTGRAQHPIFNVPVLEYTEDAGSGYGEWKPLYGSDKANLTYDQLSGLGEYTDPTIMPGAHRKYRIRTLSYGLAGEVFTSDYGPESPEAFLTAPDNWWLKDLVVADYSVPLTVLADAIGTTSKDSSTIFQPIGEDLPIIVTQGYKGETIALRIKCVGTEYANLMRLLNAGRTLLLQSDADKAWWVRPQGDIQTDLQPSNMRKTKPVRFVSVSFVEVAPDGAT